MFVLEYVVESDVRSLPEEPYGLYLTSLMSLATL